MVAGVLAGRAGEVTCGDVDEGVDGGVERGVDGGVDGGRPAAGRLGRPVPIRVTQARATAASAMSRAILRYRCSRKGIKLSSVGARARLAGSRPGQQLTHPRAGR